MRAAPILLLLVWTGASAAAEAPGASDLVNRIDAALAKSGRWLIKQQAADGAWYSETYGALRTGPTLTPYVLSSLLFLPQAGPEAVPAYRRGVDYLAGFVGEDGRLKVAGRELSYPVYTAAMTSRMVVHIDRTTQNRSAQKAWIEYLRQRQLNESLGWTREDVDYGGWGFALDVPRKPAAGEAKELFHESNVTATLFAVAAIRADARWRERQKPASPNGDSRRAGEQEGGHAGALEPHFIVPARTQKEADSETDPALRQALVFVQRCQNLVDDAEHGDPKYDDGGFYFRPDDPAQNKAGIAGADKFGRTRFRSYGTMTADGLRALLRCGMAKDHKRAIAARRWLEQNFSAIQNPGRFPADRAVLQDATYYYWVWAAAHAFLALDVSEIETSRGRINWAEALAEEILRRQRADGTWLNRFTDAKEDDPLVATPWATAALAICRSMITRERPTLGGLAR